MMRSVSVLTGGRFAAAALAVVQSVIVARALGPVNYGVVALATAFPVLVLTILSARSAETTTRYLSLFEGRGEKAQALAVVRLGFLVDLGLAAVGVLVVASTAWLVIPALTQSTLHPSWTIVYALSFLPNALLGTSASVLSVTGRFRQWGAVEIAAAVSRLVITSAAVFLSPTPAAVLVASAVAAFVASPLLALSAARAARAHWGDWWHGARLAVLRPHQRDLVRFYILSDANELFSIGMKNADILILGYFRPPGEVGLYSLAKGIAGNAGLLVGSLRAAGLPRVVETWASSGLRGVRALVRREFVRVSIPAAGVLLAGALLAAPLVSLVYGREYLGTAPIAAIFLAQSAWIALFFWFGALQLAWGDLHVRLVTRAVLAVATVVALFLVVPAAGGVGAAGVLVAETVLFTAVTVTWVWLTAGRPRAEPRPGEAPLS